MLFNSKEMSQNQATNNMIGFLVLNPLWINGIDFFKPQGWLISTISIRLFCCCSTELYWIFRHFLCYSSSSVWYKSLQYVNYNCMKHSGGLLYLNISHEWPVTLFFLSFDEIAIYLFGCLRDWFRSSKQTRKNIYFPLDFWGELV